MHLTYFQFVLLSDEISQNYCLSDETVIRLEVLHRPLLMIVFHIKIS